MATVYACLLIFASLGYLPVFGHEDAYSEELYIRPTQSGHIYSQFQFTTVWNATYESFNHYHLFPKSLGEVLEKWGVEELHLSQTQGLWRWDKWGYPLQDAAPGAELWVWFRKDTLNVDRAWKNLINVLSGMFCASLNFLDATNTIKPKWSFKPEGVTSHGGYTGFLRYAALPRETVCTENLTPWKKLLPCGAKSGLAVLFNAIKLYDASYHSLGIHFRPVCRVASPDTKECTETAVELKQTLSVVFEPAVILGGSQDWSFKKIYQRMLNGVCPLSESTKVYVDLSSNKTAEYSFTLSPAPEHTETFTTESGLRGKVAVYDVAAIMQSSRILNVAAKYNKAMEHKQAVPPLVYAHQFQTGFGQDVGGVVCMIYNYQPSQVVPVVYLQSLPWFLRLYIHTLKIETFQIGHSVGVLSEGNTTKPKTMHFVPGQDHTRPYQLEVVLDLPPNTVTRLSFQLEKSLLKWTEYPPDANHGFYVNSAVISTPLPSDLVVPVVPQGDGKINSMFEKFGPLSVLRIHTEHLLVTLPTPDFSMPYNVICLACTVVAIGFGSIHNLTTRRFVAVDPSKSTGIMGKIKGLLSKFRKSKPEQSKEKDISSEKVEGTDDKSS